MIDFGMPMGPAMLADLTGIDINYHVNRTFEGRIGERYQVVPAVPARLGRGFDFFRAKTQDEICEETETNEGGSVL